ncbi:MAG TPA: phosphatase PAP2 family protein [Ktedonobacteraceae bacterium]|nr:phosphatase PAP2 family protein [Ktedonobacteraceae bacterium]
MATLMQLNYMLFQDINAYAGQISWFDAFMAFCANSLIFFWPILLLMVWGIPLNWRRRTVQPGEIEILHERRAVVLWTALACLVAYAINLLIEQFVFEPRPFISHKVHLLIAHAADSSFPSDHTAWSFAVIGMLAFAFLPILISARNKRENIEQRFDPALLRKLFAYFIAAFVIGCIIGLARVFVGVHYPGDVLAGALDGLVGAYLVTLLRRWLSRPTNAVLRFAHTIRIA